MFQTPKLSRSLAYFGGHNDAVKKQKKSRFMGRELPQRYYRKSWRDFHPPSQGGYTLRVIEEAEVMRQAPQPGEGRRAMPPIGTKERRLRRRRSPIGHSNRAQFYFAKRSNFFLCVLARIIKSNQSLVVRRVCPKGTQALWCLLLNLSFLRVFPRSSSALPFPEGLFSRVSTRFWFAR